jgi:hypothetical protein
MWRPEQQRASLNLAKGATVLLPLLVPLGFDSGDVHFFPFVLPQLPVRNVV